MSTAQADSSLLEEWHHRHFRLSSFHSSDRVNVGDGELGSVGNVVLSRSGPPDDSGTKANPLLVSAETTIILETPGLTAGEMFACRIPVDVRYSGERSLSQLNVIATAYDEDEKLSSTGIATGDRPIVFRRTPDGLLYKPVALQFDLTRRVCNRISGLRIEFASCVFDDRPAENCIAQIRFAGADPSDPLFLRLKTNAG